eukprot:CAMPEP_0115038410 /NCGR_PEP_ID=MMETSP0216-20121206/43394_1 /TAXON_ID=223996 /ORGANISM="Protocruzia adherens, Strain Boccale" /LENGTH=174 /DNA_ID=CAMNT_0002418809 /DNA_START=26 /DNA_END=550 /DNA_ORIENTATION=-
MAQTLAPYLNAIRSTLEATLTIRNFPSEKTERQNKPEIELVGTKKENKRAVLNSLTITRDEQEKVLIENSINSIRISVCNKRADQIDELLTTMFTKFVMLRADHFIILRRKPVEGYVLSFLVTNTHLEEMVKDKLIDFILQFIQDLDKEIKDMKLSVNTRARNAATHFLTNLSH